MITKRFFLLFAWLTAAGSGFSQTPQLLAFGEGRADTLTSPTEVKQYTLSGVISGDVLLVRVASGGSIHPVLELWYGNQPLDTIAHASLAEWMTTAVHSGDYTLRVRDQGADHSGAFSISAQRLNRPAEPEIAGCNTGLLYGYLTHGADIKSFKLQVEEETTVRLSVSAFSPDVIHPRLIVTDATGLILGACSDTSTCSILLDSLPGACYYLFVMDSTGAHTGIFNLEITYFTGGCADEAVAITSSTDVEIVIPGGSFIAQRPLCVGDDFTLTASYAAPDALYQWTGPDGFTATGAAFTRTGITGQAGGDYTVNAYVPGGCQSTASFYVNVRNPGVSIAVSPGDHGVVCAGSDLTLAVINPVSTNYRWFAPNGSTIDGPSIVMADIDSSQAGLYRVSAYFPWNLPYINGGCVGHGEQLITVHPAPTVQAIVSGHDIIPSASGGVGPYIYAITGGYLLVDGRFQNLPEGYYVVTATDVNGCTATADNLVVAVVEPFAAWGLTLTPNPGSSIFHLICTDVLRLPLQLTLYDATGLFLSAFELNHQDFTLDLSDLPSGWYLIRVKDKTQVGTLRLCILR